MDLKVATRAHVHPAVNALDRTEDSDALAFLAHSQWFGRL
jgi:hypothetical protein